jgi:hypothetical protein
MADYKVIPSTGPKKDLTHSVQGPDGTIANQAVFTGEDAIRKCEQLNALALHKPRRSE